MGCSGSKPQVAPNQGIVPDDPATPASLQRKQSVKKEYAEALQKASNASKQYDAFLSFESTAAQLAAEVRSSLDGYGIPEGKRSLKENLEELRASRRVVILLTPQYFGSETCCAEFCEAVAEGIEVLPVCVEGSTWAGMPFPALTDVPEKVQTAAGQKLPRDAAGAVFGHTIAIEHKFAYMSGFVQKLRERLGPPLANISPEKSPGKIAGKSTAESARFDAFLSHKRSEAQDTVARVHDKLTDAG